MKKFCTILSILFLPAMLFAMASSLEVREDLFKSDVELANFTQESVTKDEADFYDNMEAFLLTGGPGTAIWENFGHAAFVIRVPNMGDVSFDYGIFTFDDSFYGNFILGKLYYEVWESYAAYRVQSLEESDRTVQLLQLDLDRQQKKNLWRFLNYNVQDGNTTYLYDYFVDNCATRLRDMYDWTTGGDFRAWLEKQKSPETVRQTVTRYLFRSSFLPAWVLNYLMGPSIDEDITMWEACFLPDTLNAKIEEYQGTKAQVLYTTEKRRDVPTHWSLPLRSLLMGAVAALFIWGTTSRRKWIGKTSDAFLGLFFTFMTVLSSVLFFMMFFTIHNVTHNNINIFLFSPFCLLLAIEHFRSMGRNRREKSIFILSVCFLGITIVTLLLRLAVPSIIQDSTSVFLPAILIYGSEIGIHFIKRK